MGEKIIYIHIGMAKTGTSAIQAFLKENRKKLFEMGYYYPEDDSEKHPHYDSLKISSGNACMIYELLCRNNLQAIEDIFNNSLKKCDNVIFSCELFTFLNIDAINNLFIVLQKFNYKIINYVRDFPSFISSYYCQTVKTWHEILEFSECYRHLSKVTIQCIENWIRKAGDNIVIRLYDGKIDVCKDFLSIFGINTLVEFEKPTFHVNESFTPEMTEYLRLFNNEMKNISDLDYALEIKYKLFFVLTEYCHKHKPITKTFFCTEEEAKEINKIFSPIIKLLTTKFNITMDTRKGKNYLSHSQQELITVEKIRDINSFIMQRHYSDNVNSDTMLKETFPFVYFLCVLRDKEKLYAENENRKNQIENYKNRIINYENEIENYKNEIENYRNQIKYYKNEIHNFIDSNSWKITKPIRAITRILKGH